MMMKKTCIVTIAAALLVSVSAFADNTLTITKPADSTINYRPRIGLVLSGGGAKGIAHVGVLRMLEELKIPVDYVTGTSIGSIIGGLYALGYTPDEMEELIINTDWNEMMKDRMARHGRLYDFNARDDRLLVDIPVMNRKDMKYDAGPKGGLLSNIPLALVEGQNLNSLFTQLSVGYQDNIDFDELPVPFACVAVDLVSRKPVIIRSGNIVDAMRSSMSIPGYFAPIRKNGMMLVDGGMLNNLPVDVVREMGADIVIAVDLHKYDKSNFKEPDNVGDMVTSILKILNGEKYRNSVDAADVCITPNTGEFGILDFTPASLKALSDSGYFAALEVVDKLEQLSALEKDYWKSGPPVRRHAINIQQDSVHVSQISISGADPKETEFLMKSCHDYVGDYVTGQKLDRLVNGFYNTRAFSKVTYSVATIPEDSSYSLKMQFEPEKLHNVGFGVNFNSEEIVSALLNVSINRHKIYGWKAELDAVLSYNPIITVTGGYAFSGKWQLNLGYRFRRSDLSPYESGVKETSYSYYGHFADLYMQRKGLQSDLRFLHRYENCRIPTFQGGTFIYLLSFGIKYAYDNRDRGYFPTRGVQFDIYAAHNYLNRSRQWNGNLPYGFLNFDISGVIPLGEEVVMIPSFYSRMKLNTYSVPFYLPNIAGGYEFARYTEDQMPFVGANYSYWLEDLASVERLDLRWNFTGKHYFTAIGNVLLQADSLGELMEIKLNWGVGLDYSYDSPIGPVGLSLHYSDLAGRVGFYIHAGFNF